MQPTTPTNEPSLAEILYALGFALAAYIETVIADALREGRPVTPAMRSLAKSVAAFRVFASVFGKQPAPPASCTPAAPARIAPELRPVHHARPGHLARRHAPHPSRPGTTRQARSHPVTPQAARTARL